jgi:hypothetical protein
MTCESVIIGKSRALANAVGDLGDLNMSEIGELLKEYRRLGAYIRSRPAGEGAGISSTASNTS